MTTTQHFSLFIFIIIISFFTCIANKISKFEPERPQSLKSTSYMCFCAAADNAFFEKLLDLIGSIHYTNFNKVKEIAVFDLGFTKEQLKLLNKIKKVSLHSVEPRHADLLKHFKSRSNGKPVRGWYAWKPVVMKQALSLFSNFLYLDAGCTVVKPLEDIFAYIKDHGYLLVQGGNQYTIGDNCTKFVAKMFELASPENNWILSKRNITAGVQGISDKVYSSYIKPIYDLTTDLRYFEDDGSSPLGFGWARHDQTLFSIQANLLALDQIPVNENFSTAINGKKINICIGNNTDLDSIQILFQRSSGKFTQFIRFKK